jgi:hypothetical protein
MDLGKVRVLSLDPAKRSSPRAATTPRLMEKVVQIGHKRREKSDNIWEYVLVL